MSRYILEPTKIKELHAGTKAREDINFFLKNIGYEPILFKVNDSRRFVIKVKNYTRCFINLQGILSRIEPNSMVLFQYPYPCNPRVIYYITNKLAKKGGRTAVLIHDIDSLRFMKSDVEIRKEIKCLNLFPYVISHNSSMTEWLVKHGLKSEILELDVFDYNRLITDEVHKNNESKNNECKDGKTVIFAGNLSRGKSAFLYKLEDEMLRGLNMNLYGIDYEEHNVKCKNMRHQGVYEPEELPNRLEGDFGLIWDGTETDTCSGDFGQYLRFNNPHKLSLYISAGIPVITWKKAAIGKIISKHNIGVLVDSLSEVSEAIAEISDERYEEMKRNVVGLQEKVVNGHHIQGVVKRIEESYNKR